MRLAEHAIFHRLFPLLSDDKKWPNFGYSISIYHADSADRPGRHSVLSDLDSGKSTELPVLQSPLCFFLASGKGLKCCILAACAPDRHVSP